MAAGAKIPQRFRSSRGAVESGGTEQLAINGNDGHIEAIVVSDLEYLQLREQGNYEHHRETPIREVEPVSEELSGHLTRKGATGRVISQSQADVREQRLARIRAKYASVLEQTKVELPSTGKSEESKQAPFRYARSVEDFLAKANASYDKFLQE